METTEKPPEDFNRIEEYLRKVMKGKNEVPILPVSALLGIYLKYLGELFILF
jgi:hypothetical protein